MGSRFEKTIAAGVMAGAIALAGCGGGGGGGGGDTPVESDVQFWGARAIDSKHLKLFFSEAVTIPDPATIAGKFTLHETDYSASIGYKSVTHVCTMLNSPGSACVNYDTFATSARPGFSVASGNAIATVTNAELSAADPSTVILTLNDAIQLLSAGVTDPRSSGGTTAGKSSAPGADGGTGVLRLAYSGGADGLLDGAGAYLPAVALAGDVLGNVAIPGGGPVMVYAQTIDAQSVRLTFNEPIAIQGNDKVIAAGYFNISGECFTKGGGGYQVVFSGPNYSTDANYSVRRISSPYMSSTLSSGSWKTISDVSLPAGAPNTLILKLAGPIPDLADYEGYLRLSYTGSGGAGSVKSPDGGDTMATLPLAGTDHRGNVKDDVGAKGSTTCTF